MFSIFRTMSDHMSTVTNAQEARDNERLVKTLLSGAIIFSNRQAENMKNVRERLC